MELVAATRNKGKLAEFARLFAPYDVMLIPLDALGLGIEIEETGATFAENARIKAKTIYKLTGRAAISDDSGLCVDALGGAPGVYSARYGGEGLDDTRRYEKLLREMENVPDGRRTARFLCAICCVLPEMTIETQGVCEGAILRAPRGSGGFGYDPVFLPNAFAAAGRGFGELSPEEKNIISHRGKAIETLKEQLAKYAKLDPRAQ